MNFLRNLIQGPVAAGGLGGPPPDTEGQREAVITQENTKGSGTTPPLSPTSTHSDVSLPGLTPDCDTPTTDDTPTISSSSTPCVTCESEVPGCEGISEASENLPQDATHPHESTGNSDSEYESAEELDSTTHNAPQFEEASWVSSAAVTPESGGRENFVEAESGHPLVGDPLTDSTFSGVGNAPSDEIPVQATHPLVNGVGDKTPETTPVTDAETPIHATTHVNGGLSEQPLTTVCESIVAVTQNEVVEEAIVENSVFVEQQVVSVTTQPTPNGTSPEPLKPVNVDDITFDIVTSNGDGEARECNLPSCVSVDVSEAKETTNETTGECVNGALESQVDGQITGHPIVSEVLSGVEHTIHSSEASTATLQEAEELVQSEEPQKALDTSASHDTDQHVASESTNQISLSSEQEQDAPPPLPSQETRETPEYHVPDQHTPLESDNQVSRLEQVEDFSPPLPLHEPQKTLESHAPEQPVESSNQASLSLLEQEGDTPPSLPLHEPQGTPEYHAPEHHTPVESSSEALASPPEQQEESPPPLPPPDPDDIPIVPKKGYNLDFLDNLDDPNFDPFSSKTAVRNTPPPSPEPGRKLPPLKPAVRKKGKKTPDVPAPEKSPETQVETSEQEQSNKEGVSVSPQAIQTTTSETPEPRQEEADTPTKTPTKPVRKTPQRKPLRKTPLKPKLTEKNNNRVEEKEEQVSQVSKEEDDLPIPPSKGYNLDFLDDLDDPNFNPFASKTAVRNSPPGPGAAFPVSQSSQETAGKQEAKVVVATRKQSPKKGFAVAKKNREVKSKSPEASEGSESPVSKKQELVAVSDNKKLKTSPSKEEPQEEEKEELPVPKKGYNLDFLDDPNFDPFQSRSPLDKTNNSAAKITSVKTENADDSVISNNSAKSVESDDNTERVSEAASPEHKSPELVSEPTSESEKEVSVDSAVPRETPEEETGAQDFTNHPNECVEESIHPQLTDKPKNQISESETTKEINRTNQTENQNFVADSLRPDSDNWNTDNHGDTGNTEPQSSVFRTPSISTIGQLNSLEFEELLEHEASRIAEEFMNCSRDSGLPDNDSSPESNHNHNSAMANTSCTNLNQVDENVNPFQKNSTLGNSPPLGKRGAVCGAESTDSLRPPFSTRRALKRDIVMGEERLDTSSLEDDSGIALGPRSDLEEEVNHSEAGPEIATGLTSNDLKCASQSTSDDLDDDDDEEEFSDQITDEEFLSSETFFKEAIDLDPHTRRTLMSPLIGSHSKLVGDDVTPTKDKKEPPASAPESPQNKPTPSTSSPAPPPQEERSAPEGTSSPSPRPSDTAERKSLSTRPTSAPPEGYMTASQVQELLKRQELKFEEKLLRVELAAGEKEKKLQQAMKDEQKDLQTLGSSVTELTQSRDALLKMVGQYKGMLASLVAEKEKEKKASEDKITALQAERDQALEDLANVEVAFSDVHRKYERTKQVVDTLKRNEETLRGAVADYEAKLKKQEQKFLEFQKHAEEKIQLANEEFESMRKSNEQEMTKMAALLKKAEMKIMSLQDSFDRKTRENQELTQLCDDLINKVGTSH